MVVALLTSDFCWYIGISNFDQLLLWLALLSFVGTILTGAYLSSFSQGFLYRQGGPGDLHPGMEPFSLFDIQLPFKAARFREILLNITSKTSHLIYKSLKADFVFMPFAYGTLLLLLLYFRFNAETRFLSSCSLGRIIVLGIRHSWVLPLLAYAMDALENFFTMSLLKQLEVLRAQKTVGKEEKLMEEQSKNRLVSGARVKIFTVSAAKWISVFLSMALIVTVFIFKLLH